MGVRFKVGKKGFKGKCADRDAKSRAVNGCAGTELMTAIGWIKRLRPEKACKCAHRAAEMDRLGTAWCEANVETIVGWLREGAAELGLPFLELPARWAVYRAIRRARAKESPPTPDIATIAVVTQQGVPHGYAADCSGR